MRLLFFVCCFLVLSCKPTPPPPTETALARPPEKMGWIEGTVRMTPPVPLARVIDLPANVQKQCGEKLEDNSIQVDADGGLANVIVSLSDIPNQPDPKFPAAQIDQQNCQYVPAVVAARTGGTLRIKNSDALLHNVNAKIAGETQFNLALPIAGMTLIRPVPNAPGVTTLGCDVHPWMRGWVVSIGHEYFTQTDAHGHFRLPSPTGNHQVRLWHPRFMEQISPVTVDVGKTATLDAAWNTTKLSSLQ